MLVGNDPSLVSDVVKHVLRWKLSSSGSCNLVTDVTWRPPSPRNWFPALKGSWITPASFVNSFAVLVSISAMPLRQWAWVQMIWNQDIPRNRQSVAVRWLSRRRNVQWGHQLVLDPGVGCFSWWDSGFWTWRSHSCCDRWPLNLHGKYWVVLVGSWWEEEKGFEIVLNLSLVQIDVRWTKLGTNKHRTIADVALNPYQPLATPYHELRNTEPRHLPRRNAGFARRSPFVLQLISLLVARKIPFDDPVVLNYVRIGYVFTQLVMLAVYYYVSLTVRLHSSSQFYLTHPQIKRKNDQTVLKYGKPTFLILVL